jgi:hypothetical protein
LELGMVVHTCNPSTQEAETLSQTNTLLSHKLTKEYSHSDM